MLPYNVKYILKGYVFLSIIIILISSEIMKNKISIKFLSPNWIE